MITEKRNPSIKGRKIIGYAIVQEGPLNVRKDPSMDAEIVGEIQKGQRFNVTDKSTNDFTSIIYRDEIRYAMTKYLEVVINR